MKASELIELIQQKIDEYGDLNIIQCVDSEIGIYVEISSLEEHCLERRYDYHAKRFFGNLWNETGEFESFKKFIRQDLEGSSEVKTFLELY